MKRLPTLLLFAGVLCVSFSGILAKRALFEATPLALAAWRMGFASLFFLATSRFAFARQGWGPALTSTEQLRLALAGAALVAHFLTWFASLRLTGIAIATLLSCSTPFWTALINLFTGQQKAGGRFWISLLLAAAGVALVVHPHGQAAASSTLWGDVLAALGGFTFSLYFLCIEGLQHIPSQRIVTNTYSVAAVLLWIILIAGGGLTVHYSPPVWGAIALVALVPQILGHTLVNNALRHFPSHVIAISMIAEPVIAAVLAHLIYHQTITGIQIAGGILVLVALGLVLASGQQQPAALAEEL